MSPLTHVAHRLHGCGFHVFPVDHPGQPECIGLHGTTSPCDGQRGKHPAVTWGTWAVAVTPKQIDMAWEKRGGVANVGVACGPSGLVVLDEDAPGEIERWCVTYGITLPDTYTVTTGRGRHLYFRWDHATQRIGNSPKALSGFTIDVRGHGGFAVAEGSQHVSGAVYTGNAQPITDLPDQVAQLLLAGGKQEAPPPNWEEVAADHHNTKIGFHHRHNALVTYGGRLRKSGIDYREAEVVFRERWLLCEQPDGQIPEARFHSPDCPYPVTWEDARAKLGDVYGRYAAGKNIGEGDALPVVLTRLADVEPERVSWLWPGRIPVGKLVTLDGDPGLGKSTVALDIAARVTTGGAWPDGSVCAFPGAVLLMSAEDGLADTIRPRCDAAGADVTKVHAVEGVPIDTEGTLRPPTLADVAGLEAAITQTGARLLVIDVVMAYLPTGTDAHKDQDIRRVLSRLAALADRTGCTVLLIRHLNKAKGSDPLYRGGGSIGIVGAARAGLLVAPDPEDDDLRVLASVKSNLAPLPESLSYRLVESGDHGVARVSWEGGTTHTAHTLLSEPVDDGGAKSEAEQWLQDYLSEQGAVASKTAKAEAAKAGIAERTLKRAVKSLRIIVESRGFPRVTWWQLPSGATDAGVAPASQNLGPTGPTGDDLHKQNGPTVPNPQSGQVVETGRPTADCHDQAPPGGVTSATPGVSDRVLKALSNAVNGIPDHEPTEPDPANENAS